ncbi:MAG TPA: hypothetical protein PKW18_08460 [Candidatus Sumerlaeota bacterium]|nr:MAG: hypothetical protein BWY12_01014 [candidate division BRC1 bacterium ADurb.Bin183]HOE63410.1 hypothetical protein [Candidatus Sumerlaeota bacterium]HRR30276.1 hypothetical protein [Candidatus Sumerlaeia bacterium]HON50889.1 hypothetical protein [Candidatus Sumerlaeota bacterium]HOR65583.1 hypothetical protein [Candidatus Sumerlaeota bacterium]
MKLKIKAIFLFLFFLCGQVFYADEFSALDFPAGKEKLAQYFKEAMEKARQKVEKVGGAPAIPFTTTIVYCETEKEFLQKAGMNPEHFIAAANAAQAVIYLNGERLRALNPDENFGVLVHEYAHLFVGRQAVEPLPRWLDEGLAMLLAGEWSLGKSIQMAMAHLWGNHIPFSRLESSFPASPPELSLAYLQSCSMCQFLIRQFFARGGISAMLKILADPEQGRKFIAQLDEPIIMKSLEEQWKKYLGNRWWNIIFLFSSGTIFWFAMTLFFLLAYLKKRKQKLEQIKVWEEEGFF